MGKTEVMDITQWVSGRPGHTRGKGFMGVNIVGGQGDDVRAEIDECADFSADGGKIFGLDSGTFLLCF